MPAALFCHVDPTREADRLRLRADHLAYIVANRALILAGGPTLSDAGAPEIMVLLLDVANVAEAESFIHNEPYRAHGVFSSVEIRPWARVLPEPRPGALDEALAAERSKGKSHE
jgi:uncharacterized protein YciI